MIKIKKTLTKKQKEAIRVSSLYFIVASLIALAGYLILDVIFPPTPTAFNWTWNGVLMFMGVAAGLGWIFHGTGFLLVRVK